MDSESSVAATVSPAPQEGTKKRRQRGRGELQGGGSMAGDDRGNERRRKNREIKQGRDVIKHI